MIASHQGMVRREPSWGSARLSLVTLLARGSTYGRVEDLDLGRAGLGDRSHSRAPQPEAWLARASARAGLHRFREARADPDRALALGAESDAVAAQRASIALASGEYARALDVARARAAREPGIATSSVLGVVLAETGDGGAAAQEFIRALAAYRDTSPFPVAFVEFRQGLLAERAGDLPRAGERYGQCSAVFRVTRRRRYTWPRWRWHAAPSTQPPPRSARCSPRHRILKSRRPGPSSTAAVEIRRRPRARRRMPAPGTWRSSPGTRTRSRIMLLGSSSSAIHSKPYAGRPTTSRSVRRQMPSTLRSPRPCAPRTAVRAARWPDALTRSPFARSDSGPS